MATRRSSWVLFGLVFTLMVHEGLSLSGVDVFVAGEGGYFCIKIQSLTVTERGTLLAMGEGRLKNCSDYTTTDLVFKRSVDRGRTW